MSSKTLTLGKLDELERQARQRSAGGLGKIHPLLLFRMLDGARKAQEQGDAELIADALASWQARQRAVYLEAFDERLESELFEKQQEILDLIDQGERRIALCCGRRAGKTKLLSNLIIRFAQHAETGQEIVFAAPTVVRAKELIWDELMRALERHGLADSWHPQSQAGTIRTSNGVLIRLAGLSSAAEVEKFSRGGNCAAFFADEAGVCWKMLKRLLKAAGPALIQTRAPFILSGTPDQVESGDWYEICQGFGGFVMRNWNLRDNPFLGVDADEALKEVREDNGWDEDHPEYVTEYKGLWCTNPSLLVFELSRAKNLVEVPVQYDVRTWRHFIGVDYGFFPDPCAWVVLAAPPNRNEVYVVHSECHDKYDSDQIAKKTEELANKYHPVAVVGDSASGGPVFMADYNRKYAKGKANIQSADKYDKKAGITLINTEFRLGRFKFVAETEHLYNKMAALRWEDEHREHVLEGELYPEDEADACRYAFLRALVLFVQEYQAAASRHEEGIRLANERAQAALQRRVERHMRRAS